MGVNRTSPDQYQLRFPPGLRDRLKSVAAANGRSLNAEIILRLESALDRQEDGTISIWLPPDLLARVYDEANRVETDPNLLIVDAVEKAYPPKPGFRERLKALADELETSTGATTPERQAFLDFVAGLLEKTERD